MRTNGTVILLSVGRQAGASSINVNGSTSHSECEYPTTIEPGVCFVAADNTDLTAHLAAEP